MELLRNDDAAAARGAGEAHLRADSARKRADEDRLVYLSLLEALHDAVILLEPDQRIRFWNDSAVRLYGWSAEEVRGRHLADVLHTEFPASAADSEHLARAVENAGRLRTQLVQYSRDGKRIEVESVATALRSADGRLTGFLLAHRDVTERNRAEKALRASEERLRLALEATSEVVWDWDLRADRIDQGPRWAQMLGYPPETTPARMTDMRRFIHPDDLEVMEREIATAVAGATDTVAFEHRLRGASGEWRWMLARARVVERNARGEGVRIVGTCSDISAQKLAEEQLHDLDRRRESFLAVLSHELRNPLAAARNGLFVLDHAPPGGPQAQAARAIVDRQLGQLTQLVEDLLDVSRITNGKIQLQKVRLDLVELARRSAEEIRYAFVARGLELRLEAPREPLWVDCDATRIVQVLGNLLQNAAKFTLRGHVLLAVEVESPGTALVRVRDTGVGIASELSARLFGAFQQADSTLDRSQGGLGLGLALVKGLVELHGGTVEVHSEGLGTGSEFVVRLPLQEAPARAPPEVADPWLRGTRSLQVVAVEDDEDAAMALAELLAVCGHRVEVAHSGPEALQVIRRVRPEVVLCDIELPGMGGYDVARAVRADPDIRQTALVALTGYAAPADVQRAYEAGFDRHLAKPIPPAELGRVLANVEAALGDRVTPRPPPPASPP
jgi:PAS domain S-box-containing protein